ncbi:chaplin [Streptomyces rimosus subsp. pseudoverticillatus]|uniref:chaplin n=1 Tax=Streptomyces rimosus TaxID=1927 RepID=UPI0006B28416|nr:chaplin [Streptomyces rimosus]KOT99311.1 chaplin [Streptomyces rimosus subsp. pseudoverticillatus]
MRVRTTISAGVLTIAAVLGSVGTAVADAGAGAKVANSPGVLSGNAIQVPVDVEIPICGNSILDIVPLLSPTSAKCKTG